MQFNFTTDEDTVQLLMIAVYFLQHYFGYEENAAVEMVNDFDASRSDASRESWGDDYYHHEGAYATAVEVHYLIGLGGDPAQFVEWRTAKHYDETPSEAKQYLRENYYKRE